MALPNNANIVILASNYNPSIVSKEWVYQRGIFKESVDNFVHTPVLSLIENQNFSFMVDEKRLQLSIRKMTQGNLNNSKVIVRKFVDVLPETPYKAVGLNYHYILAEKSYNIRGLLTPKSNRLRTIFSRDYQIGTIILFSFESFIASFTVTPSLTKKEPVKIAFNFHADVANIDEVRAKIDLQKKTLEKAELIIQEFVQE